MKTGSEARQGQVGEKARKKTNQRGGGVQKRAGCPKFFKGEAESKKKVWTSRRGRTKKREIRKLRKVRGLTNQSAESIKLLSRASACSY